MHSLLPWLTFFCLDRNGLIKIAAYLQEGAISTVGAMQNGDAHASGTGSCLQPPIHSVLIVGAGIAGLSAAHALQKQGIAFDIIDAQADVGGVWNSGYEGLRAQGAAFPLHAVHSNAGVVEDTCEVVLRWTVAALRSGRLVHAASPTLPCGLRSLLATSSGCGPCICLRRPRICNETPYDPALAGPWFMMAHPEFDMPDGKRRFGAYEYPSGKGSSRVVCAAALYVRCVRHANRSGHDVIAAQLVTCVGPENRYPDNCVHSWGDCVWPAALGDYLKALADHFGVRKQVRCNTRLVRLERRSKDDAGASFPFLAPVDGDDNK